MKPQRDAIEPECEVGSGRRKIAASGGRTPRVDVENGCTEQMIVFWCGT